MHWIVYVLEDAVYYTHTGDREKSLSTDWRWRVQRPGRHYTHPTWFQTPEERKLITTLLCYVPPCREFIIRRAEEMTAGHETERPSISPNSFIYILARLQSKKTWGGCGRECIAFSSAVNELRSKTALECTRKVDGPRSSNQLTVLIQNAFPYYKMLLLP